ncbi:MAG TPA: S8 family serine peptidase, partial [Acidimicrobiia bacterium]
MGKRFLILATALATVLIAVPATAAAPHDEFIVVLEPTQRSVPEVANEIASLHGGEVGFVYTNALQGFTLTIPANAVAGLTRNPRIAYIEPVREVSAVGTQPIPTGIDRVEGDLNPPSVPMNVDIAILDTGVYIGTRTDGTPRSHLDLNLVYVNDCTGAILYPLLPGGCSGTGTVADFQDGNGHGTHVAGIAAALDNDIGSIGVAPGATLHSFKVLEDNGTGTSGMILAGIDGVTARADLIEVANMSLGFVGTSQAINDAIAAATDAGVTFVVAAGNDAIDASQFSPANSPDVITVSAIADFDGLPGGLGSPTCRQDVDDTLADFSNFGPEVEIAAPGACIFSTHLNDGYAVYSGTSMASPFVAGAVARLIAENGLPTNNRADVEAIRTTIIGAGVSQTSSCGFTDVDNSPEPLLFVNGPAFGGDG